ncbi:ras-related protein Rab-37-like [Watersipora subatra]|uniref:ras-related protein Rab-37-like n=1 Tax=Watersipora subatra TaxID=2589382 RepID=UPI00355B34E8
MNGGSGAVKNGITDAAISAKLATRKHVSLPEFDITAKVMLVGDSSVGKTCLLTKFRDGTFLSGSFICTVGIDFRNKVVEVDDVKVKMQIWDTAGQERFRSITRAYYREAEALLLVYDVTNPTSFHNVRDWVTEIQESAKTDAIIMLLGNKADLVASRVITTEQGQNLAEESGLAFMETSAKSGFNVELCFTALARTLRELKCGDHAQGKPDGRKSLRSYISQNTSTGGCSC